MAARSQTKATAAIADIQKEIPEADIQFISMDLTSLESVTEATGSICQYDISQV